MIQKMRKNGQRHGGGWKPKPFAERKRNVFIPGIPQKYITEFRELALELRDCFMYVKKNNAN